MIGHEPRKVFLVHGKRTAFGKFGGSLGGLTPVELAVIAATSVFQDCAAPLDSIDQVIFANVIPSTSDTLYAGRHLALKCGLPVETPALVINRLCGSGIQAMIDAARLIRTGEAGALLVAGAENMTMAPHLTYGARFGTKYGPLVSKDLLLDTLYDKHAGLPMGMTAENLGEEYAVTRDDSDSYSFQSHTKANAAYDRGLIQPEIAGVEQGKISCSKDEHLRTNVSLEELQKLKPTFKKDGTVTAGSASGIVDGACAMIIASEDYVLKHKLSPLAEIVTGEVVGVDPARMGIGPVPAIQRLLRRQEKRVSDIDLFEINEAFASQVIACQRALQIDPQKLNVWGGAVALGHPLGATGLKISLTLARQLRHYNKTYGVSAACIGGGQGIALLLKKV
ncbi:MAG TPA: thiolase family protein [Bacteriovoracaceae bacterium]|nr:thiolase family protein [Bacteriovoracaceae bacterium]